MWNRNTVTGIWERFYAVPCSGARSIALAWESGAAAGGVESWRWIADPWIAGAAVHNGTARTLADARKCCERIMDRYQLCNP